MKINNKLCKNGNLFLGLNYWSSKHAIKMWENWDTLEIEKDLKIIHEYGITHLRIFPLWSYFQPIHALMSNNKIIEYAFEHSPLPNTEAGRAGVSEEACQRFEEFCSIAEKYKIKLIVGLITGHMSFRYFAPPALEGKNLVNDPTAVKWELRFIHYFVKRMRKQSAIVGWDLGNECNGFAKTNGLNNPDEAYVWCSALSDAIRTSDPTRPVITGFDTIPIEQEAFNIFDVTECADIHTVHTYNIFQTNNAPLISMRSILHSSILCRMYRDIGNIPTFLQEIGSIGYTNCSQKVEALFYRALILSSWAYNCFGVMWWCAFDQGNMDYPPYDWNTIGSDYGFFTYDRKPKPIAKIHKKVLEVLHHPQLEELPSLTDDAVCILSRNEPNPFSTANTAFCLALQANMNMSFAHATTELPDSSLYMFPSINNFHSICKRHLDKLLDRVKAGASLYISIGEGLFRSLPEITGVTIAYREKINNAEKVNINGKIITLKADYRYVIETCEAEVLATGEDGRPVYTKNRYGDGYIYFSTIPIEKYLSTNENFCLDKTSEYSAWYLPLFEAVKENHIVNTNSHVLRVTEHKKDNNNRIVMAINYSTFDVTADLNIRQGWQISDVYYGECDEKNISVSACGGVVFKITRTSTSSKDA
jgi:endo-1,4-beta-mannosidase